MESHVSSTGVSGPADRETVSRDRIERYLRMTFGPRATVEAVTRLGRTPKDEAGKAYGYGVPLRIDYRLDGGESRSAVLHTMSPSPFGHEHMPDRAQSLLWSYSAFGHLPRHVRPLDVGGVQKDGELVSLASLEEPFLLTEYVPGELYASDLRRLEQTASPETNDLARCDALCDYLVEIHRKKSDAAGLWVRRIRELVGHGECIMGLADSYPINTIAPPARLEKIECQCVRWRWKLKPLVHRLSQIHGDFHPWNVLFSAGTGFSVLDRSRGEWGEPADDVTSITANYLFFSLRRSGRLEGIFETLFLRFWERYVRATGDREIFSVAAPFFAFRGLVMASPVWYPDLQDSVRRKLMSFIEAVLDADRFDPAEVNNYCEARR